MSSYNLVVTWDSATGGTGTPGSSQLVLTSNGGLHFALLSYDSTTPDFSTAQGNNGADAYAGILTHKGRDGKLNNYKIFVKTIIRSFFSYFRNFMSGQESDYIDIVRDVVVDFCVAGNKKIFK